jgi:catechol 2,3-dioxygenase-like lactoylglutathione lyase family enzyme
MPTISKTSFVIAVPDLKVSATFYRDVLGFAVHAISDPGWLFYTSGDCTIMAGECPDAIPPRKLGDHSYFAYLQVDVIDSFYASLLAAGAEIGNIVDTSGTIDATLPSSSLGHGVLCENGAASAGQVRSMPYQTPQEAAAALESQRSVKERRGYCEGDIAPFASAL